MCPSEKALEVRASVVRSESFALGKRFVKVRKNTRRGGLNCVLKNFFVPYVEKLFSGSESEVIQSLSEFRVVCSG